MTPIEQTCPECGGVEFMGMEYAYGSPNRYDGISEWVCMNPSCKARIGRWSGKILKDGESEPPYGGPPRAAA